MFCLNIAYETTMQEDLPNIYDDHNHLEVSEYVDDIYQYYWVMEVHIGIPRHVILVSKFSPASVSM